MIEMKDLEQRIKERMLQFKGEEIIVLVNNPLDMSRWRYWFHQWGQNDTLLAVQFLDIKNFVRKKSARFDVSGYSKASRLQIEHLLQQAIKEKKAELSYFENIIELPGLRRKIFELYSFWHWHNNFEEVFKNNSFSKEQKNYLNSLIIFFKTLDKKLQENNLLHEAVYFQKLNRSISFHKKSTIFWMFPLGLDMQSYQQLMKLQSIEPQSWIVFDFEKKEATSNNKLFSFYTFLEQQKKLELEVIAFTRFFESRNSLSNDSLHKTQCETRIFSANNRESEVTLITRYVKKILNEGNKSENILILYASDQIAYSLRNSFLMNEIPVNVPIQLNWQQTNLGKFFILFLKILACLPLYSQDYFDFFTSRFLKSKSRLSKKTIFVENKLIFQNFLHEKNTLKDFIEKVKKQMNDSISKTKKLSFEKFYTALESFEKDFSIKQKKLLPSEWIDEIRKKIENYVMHDKSLTHNFHEQFLNHLKTLSRLFDQYQNLDFIYSQKIEKKVFFNLLLKDLENISLSKTNNDPLDENSKETVKIFLRHIKEGIGSLVNYAFFCGLTEDYFPQKSTGGELLENPSLQKELNWFVKSEDDIFLLEQSLQMVQKKAVFTYASDSSHGPSHVIFSLLQKLHLQEKEKQELLSYVPVLYYTIGKSPSWQNTNVEKDTYVPQLPPLSKEVVSNQSEHEKKDNALDNYYALAHKKYQVETFDKNNEIYLGKISQKLNLLNKEYSYTQIERLTSCPQKFFFANILNLKNFEVSAFSTELSPLSRGSFFHEVAQNFFNGLQSKFEGLTYGEIFSKYTKEQWQDDIKEVIANVYKNYENLNFIEKEILQKEEDKIITYFSLFFDKMAIEENTNYQVYKIEWRFENVTWEDLSLEGQVDRIDIDNKAKKILIVDYKTGQSSSTSEGKEKWSYIPSAQLAIYLLALAQKLPKLLSNWQEYSIAAKYVYVFDSGKEVWFTNEEKGEKEKFFIVDQKDFSHELFKSYTFQETKESFTSAQLIKQLIEAQSFFSIYKSNAKNSPCKYCDFSFICDGYGKINEKRMEQSGKFYAQFKENFFK